jgi:hypothetical protein
MTGAFRPPGRYDWNLAKGGDDYLSVIGLLEYGTHQ